MRITVTSRHYDLTPALKEYAEAKIDHLTTYFDKVATAHMIFALEKYRHFFEVTMHSNGKDFTAKEESEDMHVSIDRVAEKLERQILKHKGKLYNKKTPKLGEMEVRLPSSDEQEPAGNNPGEILPADPLEFPIRTLHEAAADLRDNGAEFSIFSNKETKRLTVLFKRDDGTFGLIEAE